MKKMFSLLLILLLVGTAVTASAAARVTFESSQKGFTFKPGSVFDTTDLFENFKGVMPGDVVVQRITVRSNAAEQVRLYLRAEPVDEKHSDFLEKINLQISCRNEQIFDAAPSQTGQLTEDTLLGTFKTAGSVELVLILTVPLDLDNAYISTMGAVKWTFTAEEVPIEDTPHTGDFYDRSIWLLSAGMILAAIAVVVIRMKRLEPQEN